MHIESSFVSQKPFFRRVAQGLIILFNFPPLTLGSDSESQSAMVQITFDFFDQLIQNLRFFSIMRVFFQS